MELINYTNCPCCGAAAVSFRLSAKDFTVSQQEFPVWECGRCTARFTQRAPVQEEIGRYYQADNYISHTDTRKGLINTLYHAVRNITLAGKGKLVRKKVQKQTGALLDIGAGTGAFCHFMKKKGWQVTGLEPDEATRERAASLHKIQLRSARDLFDFPAQSFDAITLWHVLEHVHELHRYLDQIRTLLRPAGRVFIALPNYTSYDASVYRDHWAAYDVPRHLYHFSPQAMKQLLEQHRLILVSHVPMWYDSFYVSMLSEQYRTGKAGYIRAAGVGLLSNLKALFNPKRCSSVVYVAAPY